MNRRRIDELFASHPDSGLFGSLPGAGPKLAPRLLSEVGSDRTLYDDAQGLQCVAGTAPVSYQSGKIKKAQTRRACKRSLRHARHLFAPRSTEQCAWAKIYDDSMRAKGASYSFWLDLRVRSKIIWRSILARLISGLAATRTRTRTTPTAAALTSKRSGVFTSSTAPR